MASDPDRGRPGSGSDCFIQEHEVLSHLLSVLPSKAQRGLFSQDINYTCIDASPEYIALGTDASLILLYDRLGLKLQRLQIPAILECVTKVKLAQSVDYVVAAGTSKGVVLIFQLPSYLPNRNKQLQMFQVAELHTSRISCFCWSTNTERLFSGDAEGNVVCTEIDYTKNESRSYLISQEPHEVVQLDYAHRALLISTKFRSVIVFIEEDCRKVRVGQKDRKMNYFGNFGACFAPGLRRVEGAELFASRPGLRLWKASIQGVVSATYMFKDLLNEKTPLIPLLPDTMSEARTSRIEEKNFGLVHIFCEDKLVTWQDCTLFAIDPEKGIILGWHGNLGSVREIAVAKDEIFVLRNSPGSLIFRLGLKRDVLNEVESVKEELAPLPLAPPPRHDEHLTDIPSTSAAAAASITILQQTASKVSQGLLDTLKEKISQVQDGQKQPPGGVPPWGFVRGLVQQDSVESVESAKEARWNSTTSLDVISPIGPPPESPFQVESSKNVVKAEPNLTSSVYSDTSKAKELTKSKENKTSAAKTQGVPGAHGMHRIISEPQISRTLATEEKGLPVVRSINKEKEVVEDDIVFSRKPKKPKKKKRANDVDSDSLHSEEVETSYAISEQSDGQLPRSSQDDDLTNKPEQKNETVKEQTKTAETKVPMSDKQKRGEKDKYNTFIDNLMQSTEEKKEAVKDRVSGSEAGPSKTDVTEVVEAKDSTECQAGQGLIQISKETYKEPGSFESSGDNLSQSPATRPSQLENLAPVLQKEQQPQNQTKETEAKVWEGTPKKEATNRSKETKGAKPNDSQKAELRDSPIREKTDIKAEQHLKPGNSVVKEQKDKAGKLSPYHPSPSPLSPGEATDSSMEDFYSHYQSSFLSPETPSNPLSLQDAMDTCQASEATNQLQDEEANNSADLSEIYTDTWTEFNCPGYLRSLALSSRQVWVVDKNERLHYSALQGPGLKWRKVEEPFHQVAVSPSGSIVWRLHRSLAYAATGISPRNPAGTKWNVSAKDVTYISLDENVAWYIKSNGNVYLQKSLSRERPTYQAQKVECKQKLSQIACLGGVVWALTQDGKILVRTGIRAGNEQGLDWVKLDGEIQQITVSYMVLGIDGTAWILDDADSLWFTNEITATDPFGSKLWWQVAISDYLIQDSYKSTMKTLSHLPRMVTPADTPVGLVSVGSNGVWVCPGGRMVLQICRGSLTGHRWEQGSPTGIAASAKWQNVAATAATKSEGLLWVHQPNNAIFCFSPHTRKVMEIRVSGLRGLKSPTSQLPSFKSLCATREVVWLLLDGGEIFIRTGMGAHCPQGINWEPLDLTQLGGVKLISLSCGAQNVWAVDSQGQVYLRIGLKPPSKNYLSPAWVPVDGSTHNEGSKFVKVVTGPSDWVVWALDNRRCVYVRGGITDALPIGTHWIYISGTKGEDLCISDSHVYTLNQVGEVFVRYGVSQKDVAGDYWKKIPGRLRKIAATHDDELWGILPNGQLLHRVTHFVERNNVLLGLQVSRCNSVSDDWEVI